MDDDMDDLEMEEWMEMSDEQHDAILDRHMAEYCRRLDAMPFRTRIAYHRCRTLDLIVRQRELVKAFDFDFMREHVKKSQVRLLKLRIWRSTGTYPGAG